MNKEQTSPAQDKGAPPEHIYVNEKAAAIPMCGVYTLTSHEGDIEYSRVSTVDSDSRAQEAEAILDDLLNAFSRFHSQMARCDREQSFVECVQFPCQNARRVVERVAAFLHSRAPSVSSAQLNDVAIRMKRGCIKAFDKEIERQAKFGTYPSAKDFKIALEWAPLPPSDTLSSATVDTRAVSPDNNESIEQVMLDAIPTSWLDSLLTGPDAVVGKPPYGCPDVVRLLKAITERQREAVRQYHASLSDKGDQK